MTEGDIASLVDGVADDRDLPSLADVADHVPGMVGFWDADLRNVVANRAYQDYFARTPSQIRGREMQAVIGDPLFNSNRPCIEQALGGHRQVFDRSWTDSYGSVRSTRTVYVPRLRTGRVTGFSVLVTDLHPPATPTGAARDLDQLTERLTPIGRLALRRDGQGLQVNQALAELTGYSTEALELMTVRDLLHPFSRRSALDRWRQLVEGTLGSVAFDERLIRADGRPIHVRVHAALVNAPGGGTEIVATVRDITLEQLDRERLLRLATERSVTVIRPGAN